MSVAQGPVYRFRIQGSGRSEASLRRQGHHPISVVARVKPPDVGALHDYIEPLPTMPAANKERASVRRLAAMDFEEDYHENRFDPKEMRRRLVSRCWLQEQAMWEDYIRGYVMAALAHASPEWNAQLQWESVYAEVYAMPRNVTIPR
jgi:hypothetical protein